MYGGLFGDLPSAKSNSSPKDNTKKADDNAAPSGTLAVKKENESQQAKMNKKKAQSASLVSAVGRAGTSMAFVPVALRQRKRPIASQLQPPGGVRATFDGSNLSIRSKQTTVHPESVHTPSKESPRTQLQLPTTILVLAEESTDASKMLPSSPLLSSSPLSSPQLEEESDELSRLHASVTDFYDPLVPNDLLAFWNLKSQEKMRIQMEKGARETLDRQKKIREQLEKERQEIAVTGTVEEIANHRAKHQMGGGGVGMGRGRGRGISNLPAWLVQKQQKQDALGSEQRQPRTLLLSNLTAPGDVDNDLALEVQEECQEKCGKVISVKVHDALLPHQPQVRVFVTFADLKDAEKGVEVFDGRSFGQRSITAKLVEEVL